MISSIKADFSSNDEQMNKIILFILILCIVKEFSSLLHDVNAIVGVENEFYIQKNN